VKEFSSKDFHFLLFFVSKVDGKLLVNGPITKTMAGTNMKIEPHVSFLGPSFYFHGPIVM